ncbi:MAG: DHA2 family efflux MFS transporter permease subunit [Gammaproteobacteria bacterium]
MALVLKRKWWILISVALCISMLYIDQTGISVVLPQLKIAFACSDVEGNWVINSMLLSMAILIAIGGNLSDRFGTRRSFLYGTAGFAFASVLCGMAPNVSLLIAGRALQGVFAALLLPSTSISVVNAFPERQVGTAMGIYIGSASIFLILGPLLAGFLTEYINWRWVFYVNVPLTLLSLYIANFSMRKTEAKIFLAKKKKNISFDWLGFSTLGIANTACVVALMEGGYWGWRSPIIIGLVLLAFTSYFFFLKIEKKLKNPLIDFQILRQRNYAVCAFIMCAMQFCLITRIFLIIMFQTIGKQGPVAAGLLILPSTLPIMFVAPLAGYLMQRFGPKLPIRLGTILTAISLVWLVVFITKDSYALLFVGLLLFGVGVPLALNPSLTTALSSVGREQRGTASGIIQQLRQLSGTLGVAVIGSVIDNVSKHSFSHYLGRLGGNFAEALQNISTSDILLSTNSAKAALKPYAISMQNSIDNFAEKAYLLAFRFGMLVTALVVLLAVILAFTKIKQQKIEE